MKEGEKKQKIIKAKEKDKEVHFALWRNDWIPLRFWAYDIKENSMEVLKIIKDNLFNQNYIKKREEQRREFLKATTHNE